MRNKLIALCASLALLAVGVGLGWQQSVAGYFQVDFSAYYAAGANVIDHRSPYAGGVTRHGETFKQSQFLQPPIVAAAFAPLAQLDYQLAKAVFFAIEIAAIVVILALGPTGPRWAIAATGAVLLLMPWLCWPLFAHLERGQTDLLVLLFISLGLHLWRQPDHRYTGFASGVALGLAAMLKLPAAFLFVVPLAEGRKNILLGGIAVLGIGTAAALALFGRQENLTYFLDFLPGIASTGELPPGVFDPASRFLLADGGRFVFEGKQYLVSLQILVAEASLTRIIGQWAGPVGTLIAGGTLLIGTGGLVLLACRILPPSAAARQLVWPAVLLTVLIGHPLTWVMQYVWLIVAVPLLVAGAGEVVWARRMAIALSVPMLLGDQVWHWIYARCAALAVALLSEPQAGKALRGLVTLIDHRLWSCAALLLALSGFLMLRAIVAERRAAGA